MTDDERERTPEEQWILDPVAESRGEAFVAEYAELILTRARLTGGLQDEE